MPPDSESEVAVAVDLGGTRMKCGLVAAGRRRAVPRDQADAARRRGTGGARRGDRDGGRARPEGRSPTAIRSAPSASSYRASSTPTRGTVRAENLAWLDVPVLAELTGRGRRRASRSCSPTTYAPADTPSSASGALAGTTNSLFLPLGTGIAAAMVVDGSLVSGDGYAGELGHTRFVHARHRRALRLRTAGLPGDGRLRRGARAPVRRPHRPDRRRRPRGAGAARGRRPGRRRRLGRRADRRWSTRWCCTRPWSRRPGSRSAVDWSEPARRCCTAARAGRARG